MNVEDIKENVKLLQKNRCNTTIEEEAKKLCYSRDSVKKFKNRVNAYVTSIFNKTGKWAEHSPMIIYEVNGTLYLVDGQGRFEAVKKYNEKPVMGEIKEIPVTIYWGKTMEETEKAMMEIQENTKKWTTDDKFRNECLANGEVENCFKIQETQDYLESCGYIAKLILFDCSKASHINDFNGGISPYCEIMKEAFKKFYDETVCYAPMQKQKNAIKKTETAIALHGLLKEYIRKAKKSGCNEKDYPRVVEDVLKQVIKYTQKLLRNPNNFATVFGGKNPAIRAYFTEAINLRGDYWGKFANVA